MMTFTRFVAFHDTLLVISSKRAKNLCCSLFHKRTYSTSLHKEENLKEVNTTSKKEIRVFLNEMKMQHSEKHACIMTTCLRNCKNKVRFEKLDKLYINSTTGYFACHGCHKTGSWSKFKENTLRLNADLDVKKRLATCFNKDEDVKIITKNPSQLEAHTIFDAGVPLDSCDTDLLKSLLEDLNIENIQSSTLHKYQVRVKQDYSGLIFPLISLKNSVVGIKIMSLPPKWDDDQPMLTPSKADIKFHLGQDLHGLFGFNLVLPSTPDIVLTSNELDALSIHQETGKIALCLPTGDLPQEILPLLEPIPEITLWMGGDKGQWDNIKHIALRLGDVRCQLIRPDVTRPAAYEACRQSLDFAKILESSVTLKHKYITTISDSMEELRTRIYDSDKLAGVKWNRFPKLNQLLKGHRRGELTILSGPTGSGKTTFVSEYSLDLAMQGVKTLWGSFEINNIRLMEIMLNQHAKINMASNSDQFDQHCKSLSELPLYFMTFSGQESIQKVIDVMTHAVYVHDIAHVVVDNLQFMMGVSESKHFDKYQHQDVVYGAFRKFATQLNCHITLIIHPRKEDANQPLSVHSLFGSVRASQEADNILLLQSFRADEGEKGKKSIQGKKGKKFIQVAKNRYDGEMGKMLLKFNKECLSFGVESQDTRDEEEEGNNDEDKEEEYDDEGEGEDDGKESEEY